MKKISILGCTGSVGVSTLDVCRHHPDLFQVVALAAGRNVDLLREQIVEFRPQTVSVGSHEAAEALRRGVSSEVRIVWGKEGVEEVAVHPDSSLVVSAIVGAAGLKPTLRALHAGKNIALANKESMVIAGEIMSTLARQKGAKILPVDSEHSAIFQCLQGSHADDVDHLILTASGGPFLHLPVEDFKHITREQALDHPNWDMGAKITIDSATMMNKGLEVMEARWLFNLPVEKIHVVIHPQSIVHSMVEFVDGSVIAQMGEPDMRVPIAYALSQPRRVTTGVARLDLPARRELTFFTPDTQKFRCLALACDVARRGRSYPPVLNAANEAAVAAFLDGRIAFTRIAELVENCLESHKAHELNCLDDVLAADAEARRFLNECC